MPRLAFPTQMSTIGFTGTRNGMTPAQVSAVRKLLDQVEVDFWAHHGDCVGSDSQFHRLARDTRRCIGVHGHPPVNTFFRAYCQVDREDPPSEYLARDRVIVANTIWLIATPAQDVEIRRSGTWATVREARRRERWISIVYPRGNVDITR